MSINVSKDSRNHIIPDNEGVYHPKDTLEVKYLVQQAARNDQTVRVKASGHAWPPAIATGRAEFQDGFKADPNAIYQLGTNQLNLKLDGINYVHKMSREEAEDLGIDWTFKWGEALDHLTTSGGLFRVGAGTVLGTNAIDGVKGPTADIKNGVVYKMDQEGHALFDLGGIYSQTIAGYLSTGAAGGSTVDSIELNVIAYNTVGYSVDTITGLINAKSQWIRKSGTNVSQEETKTFNAYATSMGLLGVTVEVILRGIPRYAIVGYEITTKRSDCEVDLFGDGGDDYSFTYKDEAGVDQTIKGKKRSMKDYLLETKYTRLEWWPQKGVDAVVLWKAEKIDIPRSALTYPTKDAKAIGTIEVPDSVTYTGGKTDLEYPTPYRNAFLGSCYITTPGEPNTLTPGQITPNEILSSIFLTLVGNLNNLSAIPIKLGEIENMFDETWFDEFQEQSKEIFANAGIPENLSKLLGENLEQLLKTIGTGVEGNDKIKDIVNAFGKIIRLLEPQLISFLYSLFAAPISKNGPQQFCDIWFEGLPMDKEVNYVIIPVVFTELWFPIDRSTEVMRIIQDVFTSKFKETTLFAIEFYAGANSESWLSASGPLPPGADKHYDKDGKSPVLRTDLYYFPYNAEPGVSTNDMVSNGTKFFSKKWKNIAQRCAKTPDPIPFKFHLGKYSGNIGNKRQYKDQYKQWGAWHDKRNEMDPLNVFVNDYWAEKLKISKIKPDNKCQGCTIH